jgi:hypothetical protein
MEVVKACVPIIPSADLPRSLRFWTLGLGFEIESEMREADRLVFCWLRRGDLCFMLNRRAGSPERPPDYEGIRLYWTPLDLAATRERLQHLGYVASEIVVRDYGQTEFFVTDDDGYSHCFGVRTDA